MDDDAPSSLKRLFMVDRILLFTIRKQVDLDCDFFRFSSSMWICFKISFRR